MNSLHTHELDTWFFPVASLVYLTSTSCRFIWYMKKMFPWIFNVRFWGSWRANANIHNRFYDGILFSLILKVYTRVFSTRLSMLFFFSLSIRSTHALKLCCSVLFLGYRIFGYIQVSVMEISRSKCIKSIECSARAVRPSQIQRMIKAPITEISEIHHGNQQGMNNRNGDIITTIIIIA